MTTPLDLARRCRAGLRTLGLIDIENLCAGVVTGARVEHAWAHTLRSARLRPSDHIVVATDAANAAATWSAMPRTARRLIGYGHNGADLALLDAADIPAICTRYQRVVLASGDGIFATLVDQLRGRGILVDVVGLPGSVSRALRPDRTHLIPQPRTGYRLAA